MDGLLRIRWMIRRDLDTVLDIEQGSFPQPWSESDLIEVLRQRNNIPQVVEDSSGRVVGFMIYQLHKSRLVLLNLAVHPDHRRQGVGTVMVDFIKGKLTPTRRYRLEALVSEHNLAGLMFFKSCGLIALRIVPNAYEGTPGVSGIHFEYQVVDIDALADQLIYG